MRLTGHAEEARGGCMVFLCSCVWSVSKSVGQRKDSERYWWQVPSTWRTRTSSSSRRRFWQFQVPNSTFVRTFRRITVRCMSQCEYCRQLTPCVLVDLHDRAKVFAGIPTFRELDWQKWIPNSGTMFFSPISPVNGADALAQVGELHVVVFCPSPAPLNSRTPDICKARFDEFGFDLFDVLYVGPRELHHICSPLHRLVLSPAADRLHNFAGILLFDKTDEEQRRKAFKCIQVLIEDHAKLGYGGAFPTSSGSLAAPRAPPDPGLPAQSTAHTLRFKIRSWQLITTTIPRFSAFTRR